MAEFYNGGWLRRLGELADASSTDRKRETRELEITRRNYIETICNMATIKTASLGAAAPPR